MADGAETRLLITIVKSIYNYIRAGEVTGAFSLLKVPNLIVLSQFGI